jgi:TRAP-type C4-dicarboxylate transport system permease small subunit
MIGLLSARLARIEMTLAIVLAVLITALILLNVVTRTAGAALFWVDELAIYAMAWMTFLSASAALHYGHTVAVTILTDMLPPIFRQMAAKLVDLIIFTFALAMIWFCWRWFSPLALAQHGFDFEAFQGATFNFVYAEPTTTLGIKKYWVWMVMWVFSLGASLHSFTNLIGQNPISNEEQS